MSKISCYLNNEDSNLLCSAPRCLSILLLILILITGSKEALAMNTGFSTENLSENEATVFLSNANIVLMTEKPTQKGIKCFDVNENGMIAIGQENKDGVKEICVYSSDGLFLYGYIFNSSGDFGIEWDDKNINIYFVRSDIIASINQEGKITDIAEVQNTAENNAYSNYMLYSTERTSKGVKYMLKNDMGFLNAFASSCSQLIEIKSTGEELMLYDVNSNQFAKTLIIFVFAVIFFIIAVVGIVMQITKLRRSNMLLNVN